MEPRVATWNLFHGRSQPPTHHSLFDAFAAGADAEPWDVCGLQEVPPWWTRGLATRLGATARATHTSYLRSVAEPLQRLVHERDPELIGVRGAAANVLLVRPSAGVIVDHRVATLRWLPQRRVVHAVRLRTPGDAGCWWVANVHTHNRAPGAGYDLAKALVIARDWAGGEPLVLLGDLNVADPSAAAHAAGYAVLTGHRVDHVLGHGAVRAAGGTFARAVRIPDPPRTLADHSVVGVRVALG